MQGLISKAVEQGYIDFKKPILAEDAQKEL